MNELKIHGHSGCGLKVVEDNEGHLLVEKSCKESYVPRLKAQFQKQLKAGQVCRAITSMPFDTPYPSWTPNDCMLMPYINAMSFVEFFERATKDDIDNLIDNLESYISYEITNSHLEEVKASVFMDKVKSVYENSLKNELFTDKDKETIEQACAYVIDYLMNIGETLKMYVGQCHGDLTFSNILFRNSGKHSLIDFLDSFVETPLQDLVKVRQDTAYGWSLMMTTQQYNEAHVKTVINYIDKKIAERFKDKENFTEHYNMLQYINILRIIPYVKEKKVYDRLIEILETIDL